MINSSLTAILTAAALAVIAPLSSAATTLLLNIQGTFTQSESPSIKVGDSYSYSVYFSDGEYTALNGYFSATFVLGGSYLLNGAAHQVPFLKPFEMAFMADNPGTGTPAYLRMGVISGAHFQPAYLSGPLPTSVGSTAEFSDFLAFNALSPSSILFYDTSFGVAMGPATSISITEAPEPGVPGLCGAAGLTLVSRRGRRAVR